MKKLGLIMALLVLFYFIPGVIGCAKTPTTPTIPTTPTTPATPTTPTTPTGEQTFKPIKLKYGDYRAHKPGYFGTVPEMTPWIKAVEGATNGRIQIVAYPSGSLLNFPVAESQVSAGIADLGYGTRLQKGILPLMDVFKLPPLPGETTAVEALMIEWFAMWEPLDKDFKAMNLIHVAPFASHPQLIVTAKKPVRTMADLKGLTLMSTDPNTIRLLSGVGAIVVPISNVDGYEALQKGMADGGSWAWNGVFLFRWDETFKPGYFVDVGGVVRSAATANAFMNRTVHDSLPKDLQEMFDFLSWRWGSVYFSSFIDATVEPYKKESAKRGIQIIVWSDEEKAKFDKVQAKQNDEWIAEMEKLYKRGAEAAELIKLYGEAHARYVPPAPVPIEPQLAPDEATKAKWATEWEAVWGKPTSTWGIGYKAYPNQTGLHKLEGNEFKPSK